MFTEGISEMVLVVEDVATTAAFYRDVIGLTPLIEASERFAWFWLTDAREREHGQRLALTTGPLLHEDQSPHPPGRRWGPVHFALHVSADNLAAMCERVTAAGMQILGPDRFEWMAASGYYVYDPAGNLLEFFVEDAADTAI